jgi:Protein of unknown function (DUF3999)
MNRPILWILGFLIYTSVAQAQVLLPRDFAYGQMALPTRAAAAYRISLPLSVYQNTSYEDLADLRVFNAEGVVVPFLLSRPAAQALIHKAPASLPLFPLHEGARVVFDGVQLTINSAGSAVNLKTQNGTTMEGTVRQYLLDARMLDATLSTLQLGWPDGAPEYTGRLSVEVSDDLAAWRSLVPSAAVANLRANGQTLVANRVDCAPTKAKFWRLSWLTTPPAFELTSVLGEPAASPTEPARAALDVIGIPDPKSALEYIFDLNAHPPVSRLNVLLPDANTIIDVELFSRSAPKDTWRLITRSGFYRLKTPDAEQQNTALEISPDTDRFWRARIVSVGISPQAPLRLHVEWIPSEVTFLPEGNAPYLLAYGNASATRAQADFSRLPTSLDIAPATLSSPQALGGASRLIVKPAQLPWTRIALWSVLFLAVILLAWMAYGLSKEKTTST